MLIRAKKSFGACLSMAVLLMYPAVAASQVVAGEPSSTNDVPGYVGRTFRVTARDDNGTLRADRVQWRVDQDDPESVQIAGTVADLDPAERRFSLGGIEVRWRGGAKFRGLRIAELKNGMPVRVSGVLEDYALLAERIRRGEPGDLRNVQITGVVSRARRLESGMTQIEIGDLSMLWPSGGFNAVESLIRRQDQRGSDSPTTRQLLGRDFGVTGKAEIDSRERRHYDLAGEELRLDGEATFELAAYYRISPRVTAYAGAKGVYTADLLRAGGSRDPPELAVERDQAWVYFERLAGSGFGLQVGRQNFKESREWWWDDDLDAARLYYDRGPWHAELGIAREQMRVSNRDSGIEPTQEDVTRILANVSWLWAPRQKLEFFFLRADDRSGAALGDSIASDREDESDARLNWYGLRLIGNRDLGRFGGISYWWDEARVTGTERVVRYREVTDSLVVDRLTDRRVKGQASDLGLSWEAPWRYPLSLGVSLARGSGDDDDRDGIDTRFRQTGLHRNKARTFGVNRYRIYGEVLRPELSNLAIRTATLGLPLGANSSLELAWHAYRQQSASDSLRDARIDADLTGRSRDVGDALDLVIGIRESRRVDIALTLGYFRAGEAYGEQRGRTARQIALEASWNF